MNKQQLNIGHEFITDNDIVILSDDINVSYKYKKPCESKQYPYFYAIPCFSNYLISRTGELLSLRTVEIIKWQTAVTAKESIKGGYKVTNIYNDNGKRVGVSRHRLLMLVFSDYEFVPNNYVVNHINGIPGDDRLDNLEWMTFAENIQHAYDTGLTKAKLRSIDAWNWITNEHKSFNSISNAARYLKMPRATIDSRLMYGNNKRYIDGWRVKYSGEEWLELNKRVGEKSNETEVLVRNIYTDEIILFPSIISAAKELNVLNSIIFSHCSRLVSVPFDKWNFRYNTTDVNWPIYSDKHLYLFSKSTTDRYSDGIILRNAMTLEEVKFGTQDEIAMFLNISKITVNKLARYNRKRGEYIFELFKVR